MHARRFFLGMQLTQNGVQKFNKSERRHNGGGPPRRLQPAPQRGKDKNNPSPLTRNHKQPPGAAAQPAEPGPNPARRGAEPTVYKAHPTHGAGTRPHRTQLKTAARKTTLNAGQCVRQPREGRGSNRQAPPPRKKEKKGGGSGKMHKNSPQPPNRPPTPPQVAKPPPRRHRRQDPHRGTGGPPTQNRQHQASNSGPRGKGTRKKKRKKKRATSPARKKGDGGTGTTKPGKKKKTKNQSAKNTPRQPSQEGLGTGETRAQHTRPHRTPEPETAGSSGAPTKPHTSQKQAEAKAQPRTRQTADTRGTTPQTVPKHTHPRPQPGLAGLTKPAPNRQPDPNTNATQQ